MPRIFPVFGLAQNHYSALTDFVSPCGISLKELSGVVSCCCISINPFISKGNSKGSHRLGSNEERLVRLWGVPLRAVNYAGFSYVTAARTQLCTWRRFMFTCCLPCFEIKYWKFRTAWSQVRFAYFMNDDGKFTFKFEFWKQQACQFLMTCPVFVFFLSGNAFQKQKNEFVDSPNWSCSTQLNLLSSRSTLSTGAMTIIGLLCRKMTESSTNLKFSSN